MKKIIFLLAIGVVLALLLPVGVAFGQQEPLRPSVRQKSTFEVANPPAQFDAVQLVVEFAPGAWMPVHSHGGQGFATVIEGAVTIRTQGAEKTYKAGETFVETPDVALEAGNPTAEKASMVITFLLPKGAQLTTNRQTGVPQLTPTTKYNTKFEVPAPPAQFDLVRLVQDFAPGAWTPLHSHGGQGLVTVLDGMLTVRTQGVEKSYKAGETFVETPNVVMEAGNTGSEQASMVVTFLLPKGAELTAVQQTAAPATLPQTGGDDYYSFYGWLILLVGSGLIAAGWFARRQRSQAQK
jgi:LPXTG-motif cell wall-anchored protein